VLTLGHFKLAAGEPVEVAASEEQDLPRPPSKRLRNALMLGAGALPFAGLIGDAPKIHEGQGREFTDLSELKKIINPGDVVLSSPHKKTFTTLGIGLGSGAPDVTHAAFVDDLGRLVTTHTDGAVPGPTTDQFVEGRSYTILRPKAGGPLHAPTLAQRYRRQLDAADAMSAKILASGGTHADVAKLRREFYTKGLGFAWTALHTPTAATFGPPTTGDASKRRFDKFLQTLNPEDAHACAGGWCSLSGALAFPEGHDVKPGRKPQDTTPADFLTNPHLEAVGGYQRNRNNLANRMIRAAPNAARLTYGTLGALGVYGADAALDAVKRRLALRTARAPDAPGPLEPGTA